MVFYRELKTGTVEGDAMAYTYNEFLDVTEMERDEADLVAPRVRVWLRCDRGRVRAAAISS